MKPYKVWKTEFIEKKGYEKQKIHKKEKIK